MTMQPTPAPKLSVKIRMYRPGLGDCFLLTLSAGPVTRHILIDCGVLQKTANERERLQKIVQDIHHETGGKLYAIVATHEHADHLSGFGFHKDMFRDQFEIDQVWMAWTENKQDPQVKETYRQYWKITAETLDIAIKELEKRGKDYAHYKEIQDFLDFGAMDVLKDWGEKQLYLAPNPTRKGPAKVIKLAGLPNVKVHILAPPKDLEALKRGDPPKSKQQLDRGEPLNQATALVTAIYQLGMQNQTLSASKAFEEDVKEIVKASQPFVASHGIPLKEATQDDFFRNFYGTPATTSKAWQRIDTDWLEAVGSLALDLDSDVNNTSLVLAFELLPSRKVLLFCADAQYGNWKSWTKTPKGKDLLSRTVFYKVGHHGSHNATQLEGGLLAMSSEELVAMIPVDREKAASKHWKMPAPILEPLLTEQTRGRVISAFASRLPEETQPILPFHEPAFPEVDLISRSHWEEFIRDMRADRSEDALWVEYTLTA